MREKDVSRSLIAIKSSSIGLISQIILMVVSFIVRTCFIQYLGVQVLGVDGVIRDCIAVLSLADMGISTSMIFRLYRPIIDKDIEKINDLMAIYKQVYRYIAAIILFIGIILSLFLKIIITKVDLPWIYIYIAYYVQLISTVSSYLLAYKRTIFEADQKKYLTTIIDTCMTVIFSIFRIYIIIAIHNYILYLVLIVIQNITSNTFVNICCKKYYPYIDGKNKINKDIRKLLMKDTKDVFAGKIVGYIYNSTDNLIISIFKSTILVGYLSNYKYIMTAVQGIMNCIVSPIQPLIGNYLNTTNDKKATNEIFNAYTHIRYLLALLLLVPTVCLTEYFISFWAGESYLLTRDIVILLAIDLYIGCVYGPLGEFINGLGMFRYLKYATLAGALTNLGISLIGVKIYGIRGVLFGTVLSQIVMWISKSNIVFKFYFESVQKLQFQYWMKQLKYFLVFALLVSLNFWILTYINVDNFVLNFIFRVCIIEVIVIIIYYIFYRNTFEFISLKAKIMNLKKQK